VSEPALVGAGLLREFADGYALASFGWTTLLLERLEVDSGDNNIPLPHRNELEEIVSARGVDDWIESLGYSLVRRSADGANERLPDDELIRDDAGADGLVSDWGLSLDGYCRAEGLRQTSRGRVIVLSIRDSLREAAISNLVLARRWLRWARARMGPSRKRCAWCGSLRRRQCSRCLMRSPTKRSPNCTRQRPSSLRAYSRRKERSRGLTNTALP
jgi:hypothetical protein